MYLQVADLRDGPCVPGGNHLLVVGPRRIQRVLRRAKEEFQGVQRAGIHALFRAEDLRQSVPAMVQKQLM